LEGRKAAPVPGRLFGLAGAGGAAVARAAAAAGFAALALFAHADFTGTAGGLIAWSAYAHVAWCFHHFVV